MWLDPELDDTELLMASIRIASRVIRIAVSSRQLHLNYFMEKRRARHSTQREESRDAEAVSVDLPF